MRSVGPVLAAVVAVGFIVPAQADAARKTVSLQASDFRFCAAGTAPCLPSDSGNKTTVKVGTRVVWTYTDRACDAVLPCPGHNVLFSKGGGTGRFVKTDGKRIFSMVFRKAGTYSYFCSAHQSFGMTGSIVVTRH
jgi:hypothetical protein